MMEKSFSLQISSVQIASDVFGRSSGGGMTPWVCDPADTMGRMLPREYDLGSERCRGKEGSWSKGKG